MNNSEFERRHYSIRAYATFITYILCIALGTTSFGDSPAVEAAWVAVRDLVRRDSPDWRMMPNESMEHWMQVAKLCQDQVDGLMHSDEGEAELRSFIRRFSASGPEADFGWFLALNHIGGVEWTGGHSLRGESTEEDKQIRRQQLLVASMQVQLFRERPQALNRYGHLTLWMGCLRRADPCVLWIHAWAEGVRKKPDSLPRNAWHDRNTMVLMQLCGKAGGIRAGMNDAEFYEALDSFSLWFLENAPFLYFDEGKRGWRVSDQFKKEEYGYIPYLREGMLPTHPELDTPFEDWKPSVRLPVGFKFQLMD